jgi:serine/threonine protein phosphatase PrpC
LKPPRSPLPSFPSSAGTSDPELEGHSFIAVYDGHGGQYSAIYAGKHMADFVRRTVAYTEYKTTKDVAHLQVRVLPCV